MSGEVVSRRLGKYRLLATLGEGGMANVYLAVAQGPAGFSKLVVLKVMRATLAKDPELVALFLEEARLAARLSHPHVVQTNEVGEADGAYFLAMEYLDGQSLSSIVEGGKKMPLDMHLRVLADALAGLEYAHGLTDFDGSALHLIHRDVSPQNVFVTYDGRILLLDFGIAKVVGRSVQTETGVLRGKLSYMAPEQLAGDAFDQRVDLYAMGVMIWEAATGKHLRAGTGQASILHKALNEDAPNPRTLAPGLPEALERICTRALSRDPEKRYQSARSLRIDLEDYLRDKNVTARDVGQWVARTFDDQRASIRAIIEKQLSPAASGSLPVLPGAVRDTTTASTAPPAPRDPRLWLFGITVVALAAVVLLVVRAKSQPVAGAAPAATQSVSSAPAGCTGVRSCPDRHVCRAGACVALTSPDCFEVVGDWTNDDAVFIGEIARLDASDAGGLRTSSPDIHRSVELALREISQTAVGLPGGPRGKPRPLVLVKCSQLTDPLRAARHLVDVVQVPAILGPANSGPALKVAQEVTLPKGVLLLSYSATSPALSSMRADGLFARTIPSDELQGHAMALAAADLKPKRVALIAKGDTYGATIRDVVLRVLSWDNATAAQHQAAGRFLVRDHPSGDEAPFDPAPVADSLAAFRPDVVVAVGTWEVLRVIEELERRAVRPHYVLSDGAAIWELLNVVQSEGLRKRIRGTQPRVLGPTFDAFRLRHVAAYPGSKAGTGAAAAYDATYALFYAMAASEPPLTGRRIAMGLRRLIPPGEPIAVEPASIHRALQILEQGGRFDLQGATGALDFDPLTGDVHHDLDVFCIGADAEGKPAFTRSGRYFSASTRELLGTFNAPGNPCRQ
jgi:serine/threonine protein kinase/ABC-type branched-subunit amino acid transport system substrate-binding protein